MNKLILAVLVLVGMAAQAGVLDIKVGPNPAQVLPVNMVSCKNLERGSNVADVMKPSFEFTTFRVNWTGEGYFTPAFVSLEFSNKLLAGGSYTCTIAGDELSAVLSGFQPCSLRCGSMIVDPNIQSITFKGTLRVVGVEQIPQAEAGNQIQQIFKTVPISVHYEKQ